LHEACKKGVEVVQELLTRDDVQLNVKDEVSNSLPFSKDSLFYFAQEGVSNVNAEKRTKNLKDCFDFIACERMG
jgi:hypothetical protein